MLQPFQLFLAVRLDRSVLARRKAGKEIVEAR
jgi:hypothetical protein